ncbi:CHAT domain-containing protein [Polyangium aurulentum]|uniref:CHAT domain-containing protein n=1 Tax=Polyangium aurulentum TaxID=2567896 RepID=UPI0010AE957D|nr:CHAT domain-containing protein [Polyangium aurulentum]UQA61840.1 CHAT domain-containing protein [Polyangium aurulentum]
MSERVVALLDDTEGPIGALAVMVAEREARDRGLSHELETAAAQESDNPAHAGRLMEMAEFVRTVHSLADAFTSVHDLPTLVAWFARSRHTFLSGFAALHRRLAGDASEAGDSARAQAFRRGLVAHVQLRRLLRRIARIHSLNEDAANEYLERNPNLCDQSLHHWLELAAQAVRSHRSEQAASYRFAREHLMLKCRRRAFITSISNAAQNAQQDSARDSGNERTTLAVPLSPFWAENWHLLDMELNDTIIPIVDHIATGTISFHDAISQVAREALPSPVDVDRRIHVMSIFAEQSLRTAGASVAPEVLSLYRSLIELRTAEPRFHATLVLHYATAMLLHFRALESPRTSLEEAVACIGRALAPLDSSRSPRLVRDLLFSRGRINENIGQWKPDAFSAAAEDLREGLAIAGVGHEREARGRALGDLANVLRRIRLDEATDAGICATYDEALTFLPAGDSTTSRAIVLNNYAGYLQERHFGDAARNRERALELINEAIELLANLPRRNWLDAHERGALASAYMTRGNIIRSRSFGKQSELLGAAIASYQEGLRVVGSASAAVSFLLGMNLASAYVERYRTSRNQAALQHADLALAEAESLLTDHPRLQSLAGLRRSTLELEMNEESETLDNAITTARAAAAMLAKFGEPVERANALMVLGELHWRRSARGDRADFAHAASIANDAYRRYLDMDDLERAILAARMEAGIAVQLHASSGERVRLVEAAEALGRAASLVEQLWLRFDASDWRTYVSIRFGSVHADRQWCQAALGEPAELLWESSGRAKSRELLGQISALSRIAHGISSVEKADRLGHLREDARRAEARVMDASAGVAPLSSVWEALQVSASERERIIDRMRLLGWRDEAPVGGALIERLSAAQQAHPDTVIMDFTTSRWGTTVLLRLADGRDHTVSVPLTMDRLHALLWGDDGWCVRYDAYRNASEIEAPDERKAFGLATTRLLEVLSTELLTPLLSGLLSEIAGKRLVLVPGPLAGLPLHAVKVGDTCLIETVGGLAYAPTAAALSPASYRWSRPARVLCILAEPADVPSLTRAPLEVAEVARRFAALGAAVSVLASVGQTSGSLVFASRGIELPPSVCVEDVRPTPEMVKQRISSFDLVFYSGHGISSGLVLVNEQGTKANFTSADLLTTPELRNAPLVQLSACETAYEDYAGALEMFSFVTGLLRHGAGFVTAGMWLVLESWSHDFTTVFQSRLIAGVDPASAVRDAILALKRRSDAEDGLGAIDWAPFAGFLGV